MLALVERAVASNPSYARGLYLGGLIRLWAVDPDLAERRARVPMDNRGERPALKFSDPRKALELSSRQVDCLVYRFALLRTLGDHFADGALREHLRAEARGRRIAGQQGGHFPARRIIVKRPRWGLLFFPGLEVSKLLEWRNVDAVASGDEPFN